MFSPLQVRTSLLPQVYEENRLNPVRSMDPAGAPLPILPSEVPRDFKQVLYVAKTTPGSTLRKRRGRKTKKEIELENQILAGERNVDGSAAVFAADDASYQQQVRNSLTEIVLPVYWYNKPF